MGNIPLDPLDLADGPDIGYGRHGYGQGSSNLEAVA